MQEEACMQFILKYLRKTMEFYLVIKQNEVTLLTGKMDGTGGYLIKQNQPDTKKSIKFFCMWKLKIKLDWKQKTDF